MPRDACFERRRDETACGTSRRRESVARPIAGHTLGMPEVWEAPPSPTPWTRALVQLDLSHGGVEDSPERHRGRNNGP